MGFKRSRRYLEREPRHPEIENQGPNHRAKFGDKRARKMKEARPNPSSRVGRMTACRSRLLALIQDLRGLPGEGERLSALLDDLLRAHDAAEGRGAEESDDGS